MSSDTDPLAPRAARRGRRPTPVRRTVWRALALAACPLGAAAQTLPMPTGPQDPPVAEPVTQQVRVQARRVPAQGSLRSLTGQEAASVPGAGNDPLKAVQTLPGVVTPHDGSGEPAVRGSRPSDNAYLVDGAPVGYLFHAGGLMSVVPGPLVRQFDLHSAAFGPQFPDVTGAVLAVGLRDPGADRLQGEVDASFLAAGVVAEGPLAADHRLLVGARLSYLDALIGEQQDEHSGVITQLPRYRDHQLKYLWTPEGGQRVSLSWLGAQDRLRYRVPAESTAGAQDPIFVGEGHERGGFDSLSLVWTQDGLGGDPRAHQRLSLSQLDQRIDSRTGQALSVRALLREQRLRYALELPVGTQHVVTLGGGLTHTRADLNLDMANPLCTEFEPECDFNTAPRERLQRDLSLRERDLHLSDRWRLHADWTLTSGLRWSHDAYLGQSHLEPRLGLEWAWSAQTTWLAGWGRHHQQPAAVQLLPELGNPGLRHLRAEHRLLGVAQKLDAGWQWRLELYDKTLDQLVLADPLTQYRNGGHGHAWGAELLLRRDAPGGTHWRDQLSGWLSVSWARSVRVNEDTGETFRFQFDQPLVMNLVGQWAPPGRWRYGLRLGVHSGSLITPIVGGQADETGRIRPVYGPINSERLPTYARLDLRLDHQFNPRLTGYAEWINATGHRNLVGYAYNADYSERTAETQLPTLVSLGVQWKF
ncbi:TonB-dependent receptor plug domain-containing protein [Ideonella livida]|uniref:TonB-dependent receptor n=1 Tax=Ideonella livida TaxID=2707176 RepID=A0A7C9TJW6_9BURK|nr:TonB-dependent receptor [Ideonella livida]NDY91344.1 TonB-dependent receptor [Ideonella livida]